MISDKQRREVAEKFRRYNISVFKDSPIVPFLDCLGVGYMNWRGVLDNIADLIDRPTCMFKPAYEPDVMGKVSLVECSKCGWTIEPWNVAGFNYCPNCGAEVVADDD